MLLSHSITYLAAKFVPALVSLALLSLFTRYMTPELYGQYALAIALVSVTNVSFYQWIKAAVQRYLPGKFGPDASYFKRVMLTGFILSATGASVVVYCLAEIFLDTHSVWLYLTMILLCWAQGLFELHLEISRSSLVPKRYAFASTGRALIFLTLAVPAVIYDGGVLLPLLSLFLSFALACMLFYRKTIGNKKLEIDSGLLLKSLKYGAPVSVAALCIVVIGASDKFVLSLIMGNAAVGLYSAGYALSEQSIGVLLIIVNLASYPLIVKAYSESTPRAFLDRLRTNQYLILVVGLPAVTGIFSLTADISDFFFGQEYGLEVARIMPLVALGVFLNALRAFHFDLSFYLAERPGSRTWILIFCAAVNLGANFVLIPLFGIVGAAYSTVASYALALIASAYWGRRYLLIRFWPQDILLIGISCILMAASVKYVSLLTDNLFVKIGLGVLVYTLFLWFFDRKRVLRIKNS